VFDTALHRALVTNHQSDTVSVFDTNSYALVATIAVGAAPHGIVLDQDAHRAYVANAGGSDISIIDTTTSTVIGSFLAGIDPHWGFKHTPAFLALDAASHRLYVTHEIEEGSISVVDTNTLATVGQVITNSGGAFGITFDPIRHLVYVTTHSHTLYAIDTDTLAVSWTLPGVFSGRIKYDSVSGRLYVGSYSFVEGVHGVALVDPDLRAVISTVFTPNVYGFDVGGSNSRLYTVDYWNNRLRAVNGELTSILGDLVTCCHVDTTSIDPSTGLIWFADELGTIQIVEDRIPAAGRAEDQTVDTAEDTPKLIGLHATGAQGPLNYEVVNGPAHGTLTGTAPNVTYVPALNFSGSDQFTFRVKNGSDTSNVATVVLHVTPVNDPPSVATASSYSVVLGNTLTLQASGSDADDANLQYTWDVDGDGTFEAPGQTVSYTGTVAGPHTVTVRVTDAAGATATATSTVLVGYNVCWLYDPTKAWRSGATVPVKVQLCDAAGVNRSNASVTIHATQLSQTSTAATSAVQDAGQANPDSDFRFDASLGGTGGYIFNFKTTGLSTGTYQLVFVAGADSTAHSAPFQVR